MQKTRFPISFYHFRYIYIFHWINSTNTLTAVFNQRQLLQQCFYQKLLLREEMFKPIPIIELAYWNIQFFPQTNSLPILFPGELNFLKQTFVFPATGIKFLYRKQLKTILPESNRSTRSVIRSPISPENVKPPFGIDTASFLRLHFANQLHCFRRKMPLPFPILCRWNFSVSH